ncbi:MAG TPA: hypothetical protein VGW12_04875 [Pyrinomonadaceae bacterium]|nr:hypothetical protein [Pyrinomonadaceae bacterium]
MCKSLKSIVALCALVLASASSVAADITLRLKVTEDARTGESRIYLKGRRQRNEFKSRFPDGTPREVAVIFQCDLGRQIVLDSSTRILYDNPFVGREEFFARAEAAAAQSGARTPKKPDKRPTGRILETFTVVDTGERREMFGYTARRIRTTLTWEIDPLDCQQTPLRKESDGWYVDLLYGTFCSYDISGFDESELVAHDQTKCVDYYLGDGRRRYIVERRQTGTARFGFPLALTVKSYADDGRATVRTSEVLEISREELDASLFEPPAGYTRYKPKKRSLVSRALSLFGKG